MRPVYEVSKGTSGRTAALLDLVHVGPTWALLDLADMVDRARRALQGENGPSSIQSIEEALASVHRTERGRGAQ